MALDSLYCSYLKAHYPYEFYQTLLQFHSDRGEKDKVSALKKEMKEAFGIVEGPYKFGYDNRMFVSDKEHKMIQPSLLSIKGFSQECANDLYELSQNEHFDDFYSLLQRLKTVKSVNSARLDALIRIGYFDCFGKSLKLLKIVELFNMYDGKKQIKKEKTTLPMDVLSKYASSETEKIFKFEDISNMIHYLIECIPNENLPIDTILKAQSENIGYCSLIMPEKKDIGVVMDLDCKYSPKVAVYDLSTGETRIIKMYKKNFQSDPICVGDTIKYYTEQKQKSKNVNGEWVKTDEYEPWFKWWTRVQL